MHTVLKCVRGRSQMAMNIHAGRVSALILAGALSFITACGSGGPSTQPAKTTPPVQTTIAGPQAPNGALKIDLAKIFPPGNGRDLVLSNCQNCHTFAPIVLLQMDRSAWRRNSLDHRERVTTLSDEEFATLYEYLATNFGPNHPVPELPKEFLKSWTSY